MERLTKRSNKTVHENGVCCTHFRGKECSERMGECTDNCPWEEAAWSKLADYEDAEEQGLLKSIPCRVGDTVYVATRTLNKRRGFYGEKTMIFEDTPIPEYVECKVVGISFKNKGNFIKVRYTGKFEEKYFDGETGYDYRIITDSFDKNYVFSSIGETVFLTAEAALAEKGGAE